MSCLECAFLFMFWCCSRKNSETKQSILVYRFADAVATTCDLYTTFVAAQYSKKLFGNRRKEMPRFILEKKKARVVVVVLPLLSSSSRKSATIFFWFIAKKLSPLCPWTKAFSTTMSYCTSIAARRGYRNNSCTWFWHGGVHCQPRRNIRSEFPTV